MSNKTKIPYLMDCNPMSKPLTKEETEELMLKPIVKVSISSGIEVDNLNKLREVRTYDR